MPTRPPEAAAAQLLYPTFASSLDVCVLVVLTQPSGLYSFVFVVSQAPRTLRLNPLCVASGRVYPSPGAALRLLPGARRRPRPSREPGCARRLDGSGSPRGAVVRRLGCSPPPPGAQGTFEPWVSGLSLSGGLAESLPALEFGSGGLLPKTSLRPKQWALYRNSRPDMMASESPDL